ncbi:MAG: hypothetical protein ACOY6K_03235 [Pseudomonadota bacterium]
MLRLVLVLLIAWPLAQPARAADLPMHGKIGRIFAEPQPKPRGVRPSLEMESGSPVYAPEVDVPPIVHGYYGKPRSYLYRSYYGTDPGLIFGRLPYACGWYGYC